MSDHPDQKVAPSNEEAAVVVDKKPTCLFIGSAVAQGKRTITLLTGDLLAFVETIGPALMAKISGSDFCNHDRRMDMRILHLIIGTLIMPGCLLAAAVMLLPLSAQAVDGFDMPGSDYDNFNASSAFVCRNSCGGDSRCQGWTWVKPGIQGPSGHCWLKHRLPVLVKNDCCNSGPRKHISKQDVRAEDRTDRPGWDFKNFITDSWKTCETACAEDQICAAWTYARAGFQGPRGHCWLKSGIPHPVDNQRTVSGVKFKPESVPFD